MIRLFKNTGCPPTKYDNKGIVAASKYELYLLWEIKILANITILIGSSKYKGNANK